MLCSLLLDSLSWNYAKIQETSCLSHSDRKLPTKQQQQQQQQQQNIHTNETHIKSHNSSLNQ